MVFQYVIYKFFLLQFYLSNYKALVILVTIKKDIIKLSQTFDLKKEWEILYIINCWCKPNVKTKKKYNSLIMGNGVLLKFPYLRLQTRIYPWVINNMISPWELRAQGICLHLPSFRECTLCTFFVQNFIDHFVYG